MDKTIDKKEIYLERRKRLLLWGIPAAVGIAALSVLLYNIAPTVSSRDITVGTAERGPIEITVAATGRIVAAYEEIINSPVESRVLSVYAQPGDSVKAGMPLLLLDLEQEQTELGKLQDARTMQEQQLRQIQLSNMTDISDLEMQIKVSEMNVSRQRIEVENERRLDSIGSGTGDRVRQAETAYRAGVLELEQLRTRLRNERQRASAAEKSQRLNVSTADRDIALMEKTIHRGSIPAPLDGVLTYITTDLGTRVGAGEKVAVVADLSSFKVIGEVPEGSSDRVQPGAAVTIRISGAQFTGTVSNITPQARQGVVSFVVRLDNPRDSRLRSGARAELQVSFDYKSEVLRVPNGAFYKGEGDYRMFVFDSKDRAVRRSIRVGDGNRDYVEILDGLKPGDKIIISDTEHYSNKNKLKIKWE
ncbi:MAG: efflux RND transporter periplasmic adaptor subunit [Muribaculaceae bacterium]|nr:efflux RND transporter periplasmic adaptor subunit [Muribaculaceae bacterium]